MAGKVVGIFISPERGNPVTSQLTAELSPGRGIIGDRYCGIRKNGQVTLVDAGVIAEVNGHTGWQLAPEETRRNIVTTGVDLNRLEDARFRVGGALLQGVELCEPCMHLGKRLETDFRSARDVVLALVGRGGLRARILEGALVSLGDVVAGVV